MKWYRGISIVLAIFMASFFVTPFSRALQSTSYRFDEATLGAGGQIQASSTNFQSRNSSGDIAVGESASSNFQVASGSQTTNDPTLSFVINNFDANFGSFSATTPATATASFSIINYTAYGYVVQIAGNTPANGSHTIPGMSSSGPSDPGSEQFGINLVANTSPASIGANPVQDLFGQGVASNNYNTPNTFRYVSGEIIASAPKSSGKTTYTLTYLVNVDNLTPGGKYTSNQTLVVTGTY